MGQDGGASDESGFGQRETLKLHQFIKHTYGCSGEHVAVEDHSGTHRLHSTGALR